jgi:hypothetical protein
MSWCIRTNESKAKVRSSNGCNGGLMIKIWRKFNGKRYRLWIFSPTAAEKWMDIFHKQGVKCRLVDYANRWSQAVYVEAKYWNAIQKKKVSE